MTSVMPPNAPHICMTLFQKRMANLISQEEFDKELCYYLLEEICFKDLKPKPYPSRPILYAEYLNKTKEQKKKVSEEFWHRSDISEFIQDRERIKNKNKTSIETLKWMQKSIPLGDVVAHQKIRERLIDFEQYLYEF